MATYHRRDHVIAPLQLGAPRLTLLHPLLHLLFLLLLIDSSVAQKTVPAPISIPPSTNWDGDDGLWSSFAVKVGSPPQTVRVLPSTSGSSLWTVVAEGCDAKDGPSCPDSRGGIFNPNSSTSWEEQGLYQLPLLAETAFGYTGNGRFGFDTLFMAEGGGGGVTVNHSVVAGIASEDAYIGTLGLTPYGTNFTDFNNPQPSILKLLRDSGKIRSRSWAYTAGAYYTPKKTFGSLLFGGYDTSRFVPNNLTIGLSPDISRDLLVGIQSITSGDTKLLDTSIIAYVDSTISHIWLPIQACQNFERAFSLTWNSELELYLIDDSLHSKLLADNPTVTFTIGSSVSGGETVQIEMPYGAFDLEVRQPVTSNGTSRYFPIRRAQNDTQYALGRTFLQQAYLIVDYDRNNFSLSQALFPDTGVAEHQVPILDPATANSTASAAGQGDGNKLATSAIAGIAVGIVVIVLFIVAAAFWYFRRWRSRRRQQSETEAKVEQGPPQPFEKAELDAQGAAAEKQPPMLPSESDKAELAGNNRYAREAASRALVEANGDQRILKELPGSAVDVTELAGSTPKKVYHELP